MATQVDRENVQQAYEDVRDDNTETNWLVLKYDGNMIVLDSIGTDYEEFISKFDDSERAFAFLRLLTGDELSKRAKFALIAWIGPNVSVLKKAKMSTDKAVVKEVVRNFAVEIMAEEHGDIAEDYVREQLIKAGGANYGTGNRE